MKVINATRKLPMPNVWFSTMIEYVAKSVNPGIAKPIKGSSRSFTSDCTTAPRYKPMMKATASPMTLYFEMKSLNSAHMPFGVGAAGVGFGSSRARIFRSSSNISSSLTKIIT